MWCLNLHQLSNVLMNTWPRMKMTQRNMNNFSHSDESVEKIGETGQTVVYIFPGGNACVKKGKQIAEVRQQTHKTAERSSRQVIDAGPWLDDQSNESQVDGEEYMGASQDDSSPNLQVVGKRLVQSGLINATQLEVAMYDQAALELNLVDILLARGWVKRADVDIVLSA